MITEDKTINLTWLKARICAKLELPFSINNTLDIQMKDGVILITVSQPSDLVIFDKKHIEITQLERELDCAIEVHAENEWNIF